MPADHDQAILDTLTPEEQEALKVAEYSPDEIAAMKGVADADDDDDDDDDDDEAEPAEGKAETAPAVVVDKNPVEAPKPVAETTPADGPVPDEDADFTPRYEAVLPEDYKERVAQLATDSGALAQRFREGEIDFDTYTQESAGINERRDELSRIATKAEVAQDMGAQAGAQEWAFRVKTFFERVAREGSTDYRADEGRRAELDTFVKALAANPVNENQSMGWFLREAHRRVQVLNGQVVTPVTPTPTPTPMPTSRKAPKAPVTLAQVPGAGEGPGDIAGEFVDVDGLEGLALEDAIAKMSPVQQERYMKGL